MNLFHYASPQPFYGLAGRWWPWLAAWATVLGMAGLWLGLAVAPTDAQQGEGYRIIFVHVPAAWMSMVVYLAMAFWAAIGLIYNARLASMMACALAPTGALMTFLALWTGALWGQPTIITPFTLAGAMAPVTLAGGIAEHLAEAFAAIALIQTVRPGCPVLLGAGTPITDMQSGAAGFSGPELARGVVCVSQLARHYGLPIRALDRLKLQEELDAIGRMRADDEM